jgi:predicted aspartyl protease
MSDGILKINPFSQLVMVDIEMWNKNKNSYSKFSITVDTGASVTTISTDILFQAGYDIKSGRLNRITTASGIEYVKEVFVEKIRLDKIEMDNVLVYAHTFPQESFSTGVLGLNVLSAFDVNFLFSKGLITLTKF